MTTAFTRIGLLSVLAVAAPARVVLVGVTVCTLSGMAALPATGQTDTSPSPPPWSTSFRVWRTHAGEPRPWRSDPRLAARFTERGFPDDLQVFFPSPDSAGQPETMWVTIIAYDRTSQLFLGILTNQPHELRRIVQFDNVTFRWNEELRWPVALARSGSYAAAGWPIGALDDPQRSVLVKGVRAYRAGAIGNNRSGIELCIATLQPLADAHWAGQQDELFILHFVLGRCYAELYETARAITQFRQALEIAPDSLDAHMALLAEYSVMVTKTQDELSDGTIDEWERTFLQQLALLRSRFSAHSEIMRILAALFDERAGGDLSTLTPQQLAKRRRVGFAVLRWKQR